MFLLGRDGVGAHRARAVGPARHARGLERAGEGCMSEIRGEGLQLFVPPRMRASTRLRAQESVARGECGLPSGSKYCLGKIEHTFEKLEKVSGERKEVRHGLEIQDSTG